MTTYLYAPKDDLKHRALWRDLYTPEETGSFYLLSHRKTMRIITALLFMIHIDYNNYYSFNNNYCFVENLKQLIASSKEYGITFYYALSPGLDILFSSTRDIQQLKRKMAQVFVFSLLSSKNVENSITVWFVIVPMFVVLLLGTLFCQLNLFSPLLPKKNSCFISCHFLFFVLSHGYFEMCSFLL